MSLEPLHERREMLCRMFAVKSAKNASIPFQIIDKSKCIPTRSTDKYKITCCNTERLKKSALPQMERLLNDLQQPIIKILSTLCYWWIFGRWPDGLHLTLLASSITLNKPFVVGCCYLVYSVFLVYSVYSLYLFYSVTSVLISISVSNDHQN